MSNKVFAFAAIAAVLSWPEDHKPGEEGLFLQPEEAETINSFIEKAELTDAAQTESLQTIERLTQENETLKANAADTDALNQRIAELEAANKQLGGQSSGSGSKLEVREDPKPADGKVSILDTEHPLNRHARAKIAFSKKFK